MWSVVPLVDGDGDDRWMTPLTMRLGDLVMMMMGSVRRW